MNNREAMWELVRRLSGQQNVIAIPRVYQQIMGSWEGAAFLNQVIYWSDKGKDGGEFAHTAGEWENELGLSRYEVEKNTRILRDAGVLQTEVRKFRGAPTVHYKLLIAEFEQWICEFFANESAKNSQNDVREIRISYTETITETTTDRIDIVPEPPVKMGVVEKPAPAPAPAKTKKLTPKQEAAAAAEAERIARLTFTKEDMLLVTLLAPVYAAKGWSPPTRFQNDTQQMKYRECLAVLGTADTKRAIERCLVQGRIGLDNIVTSLMSWVANNSKPSLPPSDPPPNQPAAYNGLREYIADTMRT